MKVEENCFRPEARLADMGVTVQVEHTSYIMRETSTRLLFLILGVVSLGVVDSSRYV